MSDRARIELFKQAVLWVEEKGGQDAVMRAFADPEPLEAAWELDLPKFKETLRALAREALAAEKRGAA